MITTKISEKFSALGLPRNWQLFVVVHAIFSMSLLFMSNELLLNISNIMLALMATIGVVAGFKYHNNKLSQWGFLIAGVALIDLSICLQSLIYFGFNTSPIIISGIEELGLILISLFSFAFMLRFEKEYNLEGFTINYNLVVVSLFLFVFIISPDFLNQFLYELNIFQQINIANLILSLLFLSMTILNHILCKNLLTKDVVRIFMILALVVHFGLEILQDITNTTANNSVLSRSSWSMYHVSGALVIVFVFIEKLYTDYYHHTATRLTNTFLWTASILAIITIPLGIIIRDRMGIPPVSAIAIGTTSFILSSIVIWRLQKLIQQISSQRENLKTIAYTDPLTELYNYHGYLEKLSTKKIENLFVVSINVEDFKSINDLYGREFGDKVLKSLALRLKKTPGIILTARTGSDYFQAVFRTTSQNIPTLIEKIQDHLGIWDTVNNRRIAVPLTFGASYSTGLVKPVELARQAEQALKSSRNQHTGFTLFNKNQADINKNKEIPRQELREILQKAVDEQYLPIHFQPIYNLQSGKLKAVELLIRAESEKHGLLLPGQFLDQAKSYDLLTSLTKVCIHMVAKCYSQLPDVTININVPPYMLNNPEVLENFVECFIKESLPMHRFCVEVTEDGDIPTDHLIPAIKLLKSHGFKIAMDDFGTGYSSLSRLSVLPVDVVKIDRSLLLAASSGSKSILESAISLTKRLGVSTVVEGVETLEQLALIKQLGADSVQGFLLSKPVKISKASLLSLNAADIIPEF